MKNYLFLFFAIVFLSSCSEESAFSNLETIDPQLEEPIDAFTLAQATSISDLQIIEGHGLGDLITLGMTREEIIPIADNGNCNSAQECFFRLSDDTGVIGITFDSNDRVKMIEINQMSVFPNKRWTTAAGVVDGMTPQQVQSIFPNSEIQSVYPYTHVVAAEQGYTYIYRLSCTNQGGCTPLSYHLIYDANDGDDDGGDEATQSFVGNIVINNPRNNNKVRKIVLTITTPDGEIIRETFNRRIPRRGSITLDPGEFVDVNGTLGTYSYRAVVKNTRGRRLGVSTGSFQIVQD